METKIIFFQKGHVITNVPCDTEHHLTPEVKDRIRKYYFQTLINENKMRTLSYSNIKL